MRGWGVNTVLDVLRRNKLLTTGLIILQIVLIFVLSVNLVEYQIEIVEHTKNVMEPLSQANFDANAIQAGSPFVSDFLPIIQSFRKLKAAITELLWIFAAFFFFGNGLFWVIATLMHRGFKHYKRILLNYGVVGVATLLLFTLIGYITLNSLFTLGEEPVPPDQVFPYVATVMSIVYLAFLLFVSKIHLPLKSIPKAVWETIRKPKTALLTLVVNSILIVISGYLMHLASQNHPTLLLLGFFLLCIVLVITRLYWIIQVGGKSHETHHT